MPKALPLPDGRFVTIREGETPEQTWARAQQMYPEAFQQAPQAKPETTVAGQAKEFFKGILPGGIGALESAAVGASALLPEDYERQARAGIASLAGAAKKPFEAAPGYEETVGRKLGEATGSIAPFLLTGPFGAAGRLAGAGLGMGMGAGEARTRAEQGGATPEQRALATGLGSVVGLSEMFAPARILGRIDEPVKAGVAAQLKRIALAGGEEAAQEAASQAAQNLIAKGIYKPEQEIIEQVGESAAYGGAVGALAQGLMDLALGRRAKGATGTPDEIAKAREEANAQREELMRKRQDPAYAQEVEARYNDLEKQRLDLEAQIKKGKKGEPLSTVDQESNKLIRKQLSDLSKQLSPAAAEYAKVKPLLAKQEEAKRLAERTPEQEMYDYLGVKFEEPAKKPPPKMTVNEFGQIVPVEEEKAPAPSAVVQYAQGQIDAARGAGRLDLADMADYLMQDPKLAQQYVSERPKLQGLSTADSNTLLTGVKLRLKEQEKQRSEATRAEMERRAADLRAQQPTPEITNQLQEVEQYLAEHRERGQGYIEPTFEYLDPLFEKALDKTPAVKVSEALRPLPGKGAAAVQQRVDTLFNTLDAERKQASLLRRSGNRPAAAEAYARASQAMKQLDMLAKSDQGPIATYASELIAAKRAQQSALDNLNTAVTDLREGNVLGKERGPVVRGEEQAVEPGKGTAASTQQTLVNKAETARGQFISAALQAAAINRMAAGRGSLTTDEAVKAASRLNDVLKDLVDRAQAQPRAPEFEDVIVQPAQMRGTQIVKPAVTERRARPRTLNDIARLSQAEMRHADERLKAIINELENPPSRAQRVETPLRQQFAATEAQKVAEARGETADTLGGELRRRTEYVRNLMARPPRSPLVGATRDALNRAADVMDAGDATRGLLDAVEDVATSLATGRKVQPQDVRAINDALAAIQPTAAEQQAGGQRPLDLLFEEPGQRPRLVEKGLGYMRATAENFENSPQVMRARMAVDNAKALVAANAKRAEAQAKADREARDAKINDLEQQALEARADYGREVTRAFVEAKREAVAARNAVLDPQIEQAQKNLAETSRTLDKALQEMAASEKRFKSVLEQKEGRDRTQLATYQLFRLEEQKAIAEDAKKSVEEQQQALNDLLAERVAAFDGKEFAAQAIKDGNVRIEKRFLDRLQARIDALQDKLSPEAQALQKQIADQRAAVRKAEQERDAARTQAAKEAARLDKVREGLGLPGVRRVEGRTEPILSAADMEAINRREEALEQIRNQQETGLPTKLTQRKVEGVVRDLRTGKVRTAIKETSLAQEEARARKEDLAGEYPAKALENLANARARLAEVENQIAYIEANPARPRTAAAARQQAALDAAIAQRKNLTQAVKALEKGQKTVEREARAEKKAAKQMRSERRSMLRAPSAVQEAIEADEGFAAPTREEGGTPISAETYKSLLDGSIVNAVNDIAENSEVPLLKETASKVKDFILRTKFEFVPEITHKGKKVVALYNPANNTVYMTPEGRTQEDLIHEVTHAATMRALTMPDADLTAEQRAAKQELQDMYDAMQKDARFKDQYALEDLKEFVSEVQSNQDLRNLMDEKPGMLRRFFNAVLRFLGVNPTVLDSAKAQAAIEKLYMQSRKIEEAPPVASGRATYANDEWADAGKTIDKFVAKNKSWIDKVKANTTGLAFETQLVDRFAGFERLRKYMEEHKGSQMMYYLRMYDQRMNMVSQAVATGAPKFVEKTRPDGNKEYLIEAKEGPSIKNVVQILKAAQPMVGNGEAVNRAFTMYMAAIRAKNKGFESLNFGKDVTPEMLDSTMKLVESTPGLEKIFNEARDEYNAYNRNLVQFVADSGAISQELADTLLEENDYIPFYRERNGLAELIIGSEAPIRIGSIKEQPYLHELVGGDQPILDFMTSSVQNTNMLLDMGLRNMSTKNAVFELLDLGAAKFVKKAEGPNVVKFKDNGETKYAVLSTDKVRIGNKEFDTGVPADILVKGMEGIPAQLPALVRAMSVPAQLLRKGVTLSPLYMARQLFRDSLAAPLLSGADFTPVLGALRQIGAPTKETLERRGITGGQQFTGSTQDISMILREIADGKPGWMSALSKFEAMGMEADALTRRAQYNSYIEQGMSEMDATLMALESMNFNKRGASPSVHWANSLIPFFNAQIQGLNVLYKAMSGKMPYNDKLRIREKLLQRGAMMAVASIAYAMAMQDDEAYQNATPEQKYGNWFVRLPGMEEPLRVPIPFEVGYIFKALPEALVNTMSTERGGAEALQALRQIVLQTIPGGSNYGIPQALKPAIEAGLGKSFYTGRDIMSQREQNLLPEEQFRANTTEVAKLVGKLGVSPIVFENLVRGYTGTMGIAFLQALSMGVPKGESPEQAVRRLSEYPVIGGAWQPNDAGGIVNSAYERMNDVKKVSDTVNKMVEEGRTSDAMSLLTRYSNEYMQAELGDAFRSNMNELTKAERAVQASAMTGQQKREQLDEIRRLKTALAKTTLELADKTIHLSSQP